jgi:signal transduction histidine kinase
LLVTEDMRGTIQSLMRLARVRGGIEKAEVAALDPSMLVKKMVETESQRFEGRKLDLTADIGGPIKNFSSDASLLRIVVATLLDNVVRHAPGGTQAGVRLVKTDEGFALIFTNESRNLKAEDVARVFEPFQRGEFAGEGGAGLGLSLAKEIAGLLGGTLTMNLKDDQVTVELRVPSLGE